jgi:hypothetical protein
MTKGEINYKNGKIYKIEPICEHDEGDVYIGSTTKQYLSQRMTAHRIDYKQVKNGNIKKKVMSFDLFEKYGIDNCDIILLESVEAKSKDELHIREAHYIRTIKCINRYIPNRTQQEYYKDNKEKILDQTKQYRDDHKEQMKQYYQDNKEKIDQQRRVKTVCECGSIYNKCSKYTHEKTKKHLNYCLTI